MAEYPEGITGNDHIAHDMKMKRFPKRSSIEQFLAERSGTPAHVTGVGRDAENEKSLVVYFSQRPSDDELRSVHERLRARLAQEPGEAVAWPFDYAAPFTAHRYSDDTVSLTSSDGRHVAWFNTHTQLPLSDEEALEQEAKDYLRLAAQIATAMNRFAAPLPVPALDRGTVEAKWIGDSDKLPLNATVCVLAIDASDPSIRRACWVRYWPKGRDFPVYRSCDLADLDMPDAALRALSTDAGTKESSHG